MNMPHSVPERLNSDDGSLSPCDQEHVQFGSQALSASTTTASRISIMPDTVPFQCHYFHPNNPAVPTNHDTIQQLTSSGTTTQPPTTSDTPYPDRGFPPRPLASATLDLHRPVALQTPILIPQSLPTSNSSFIRAYAPSLAAYDITPIDFLTFIDHLNICLQPSPPLQVFDIAGSALGFVPEPHFQIAGAVTEVNSNVAIYGVAKVRVSRYLTRVNEEFFHSRGLHVRVIKGKEIGDVIQEFSSPQGDDAENSGNLSEQIMAKLSPYVAELVCEDLPNNGKQDTALDKVAAKVMALEQKEKDKEAVKKRKEQEKKAEKVEKKVSELTEARDRYQTYIDSLEAEIRALETAGIDGGKTFKEIKKKKEEMREQEKERNRVEKDLEKLRIGEDEKKAKRAGKDEKKFEDMLFILIEDLVQSQVREEMASRMPR
ncbi:hypothetical protein KVT40_005004 [Elsinoe batatas]|uniref:Uncharacterized protein n=1 Tax=Elsinoe batatas TaxID=2601811 RepID=A0A8K0L0B3_9PEZI|nr:hypothetical protein KVT40_005004 [Elsinoe batatas]